MGLSRSAPMALARPIRTDTRHDLGASGDGVICRDRVASRRTEPYGSNESPPIFAWETWSDYRPRHAVFRLGRYRPPEKCNRAQSLIAARSPSLSTGSWEPFWGAVTTTLST